MLGCVHCRLQLESITSIPWHLAVFDEAHKLKNESSSTYKAAAALQGITRRLYGLTGTIMQVLSQPPPRIGLAICYFGKGLPRMGVSLCSGKDANCRAGFMLRSQG